jgi:hypothetical protein
VGRSIKTLETGCEIDFHFVDATTVEIGLNDCVSRSRSSSRIRPPSRNDK